MKEWGQPLHAFDLSTLNGPRIIVRKMDPAEKIELIDGTVISGESTPLVIADAERPAALAGIMGGKETQINGETVDVLLEAANFDRVQIKRSLKELGIAYPDATSWYAMFAPKSTPKEILTKINGDMQSVLALSDVKALMDKLGIDPIGGPQERLGTFLQSEIKVWADVVKDPLFQGE